MSTDRLDRIEAILEQMAVQREADRQEMRAQREADRREMAELRSTVTSLVEIVELHQRYHETSDRNFEQRLDAIASAGFGMSRSKMVDMINAGDVRVNWKEVTSSSYQVKPGDLIAIRGKGRLEIGEVSVTKKQSYRLGLTRFM